MSAYWKGIEAARRLPSWASADSRISAFLAALPPSIVIDGKVALLWDLYVAYRGTGDDALDQWADFEELARTVAAREVAE